MPRERQSIFQQRPPDELVRGVVTADVLPERAQVVLASPAQLDVHYVVLLRGIEIGVDTVTDLRDVVGTLDDPLSVQKPGRKLEVSSRGAHRDGDGLPFPTREEPYLHRLLRRERVWPDAHFAVFDDPNPRLGLARAPGSVRGLLQHNVLLVGQTKCISGRVL